MIAGCGTAPSLNTSPGLSTTSTATVEAPIVQQPEPGNMAQHGGSPTVRHAFTIPVDDPRTTNNESNDQPLGHFGTLSLNVHNDSSGNSYPLDADIEDGEVKRLYFQKGGWVDFTSSEIDSDGNGSGIDEQGRSWTFEGLADGGTLGSTSEVETEETDSAEQ